MMDMSGENNPTNHLRFMAAVYRQIACECIGETEFNVRVRAKFNQDFLNHLGSGKMKIDNKIVKTQDEMLQKIIHEMKINTSEVKYIGINTDGHLIYQIEEEPPKYIKVDPEEIPTFMRCLRDAEARITIPEVIGAREKIMSSDRLKTAILPVEEAVRPLREIFQRPKP